MIPSADAVPDQDWQRLPMYARLVTLVGVPGAIAAYLVFVGANTIPAIARQTEVNHRELLVTRDMLREQMAQAHATYRLMQRICANTARTTDERQRCFDE